VIVEIVIRVHKGGGGTSTSDEHGFGGNDETFFLPYLTLCPQD